MLGIEDLLTKFRQTAIWREVEAREEQKKDAERAEAAQQLAAAAKTRDRELPTIAAEITAAHAEVIKRREALQRAEAAHATLVQKRRTILASYQAAERLANRTLRQTAPEEIVELRRWLGATMQAARANFTLTDILPTPQLATDPKPAKVRSNADGCTAVMAACLKGIRRCDELLLSSLTRAEIRTELADIRASIPGLERTTFGFELDGGAVGRSPMFQRVVR